MVAQTSDINWLDKVSDWGWQTAIAVVTGAIGWVFWVERKFGGLRREHDAFKLHVAENYVKKTDISDLKREIAEKFKEVTDGQDQILNILLDQKIGTNARRR